MHHLTLLEIVILIAVAIGAVSDIVTKKIYNVVTFPTAAAGILINGYEAFAAPGGSATAAACAVGWSLAGGALALVYTIVPRLRKGEDALHPGDAKMWMAIGTCLLPLKMTICFFYFSLTFGAVSAFRIIKAIPRDQIKGFWLMFKTFFTAGIDLSSTVDTTEVDQARKQLIPICPAIAIGTLLGIYFDKPLMHFMGFNWY